MNVRVLNGPEMEIVAGGVVVVDVAESGICNDIHPRKGGVTWPVSRPRVPMDPLMPRLTLDDVGVRVSVCELLADTQRG